MRIAAILCVYLASIAGCTAGPYRVTSQGGVFYTRSIEGGAFSEYSHATNEASGSKEYFKGPVKIEHVDQIEFDAIVANERLAAEKEKRRSLAAYIEQRKSSQERAALEGRVRMKDWRRWVDYYEKVGYTSEEAAIKADRMMRGR